MRIPPFSSLPRHDYHVLAHVHRIGVRFACFLNWYRSREDEAEDRKYKENASDRFVTHFCWDLSRVNGLEFDVVKVSVQLSKRKKRDAISE
jgi:hypothetical protein